MLGKKLRTNCGKVIYVININVYLNLFYYGLNIQLILAPAK